jgi:hypothetical protein
MVGNRSGFACMINSLLLAQSLLPLPSPEKTSEHSTKPLGLITALMTYAQLLAHRILPLPAPKKGLLSAAPKKGLPAVDRKGTQQ